MNLSHAIFWSGLLRFITWHVRLAQHGWNVSGGTPEDVLSIQEIRNLYLVTRIEKDFKR